MTADSHLCRSLEPLRISLFLAASCVRAIRVSPELTTSDQFALHRAVEEGHQDVETGDGFRMGPLIVNVEYVCMLQVGKMTDATNFELFESLMMDAVLVM